MFNTLGILSILAASFLSGLIKVIGNQGHHNRISVYWHAKTYILTNRWIHSYVGKIHSTTDSWGFSLMYYA